MHPIASHNGGNFCAVISAQRITQAARAPFRVGKISFAGNPSCKSGMMQVDFSIDYGNDLPLAIQVGGQIDFFDMNG